MRLEVLVEANYPFDPIRNFISILRAKEIRNETAWLDLLTNPLPLDNKRVEAHFSRVRQCGEQNSHVRVLFKKKTLESPLVSKRSNQSILKEINSEDSLEGWMLKLKLQHFGHLMPRANSLVKTLMLGKTEGRRRREQHRMRRLDGLTDAMDVVGANSRK